MNYKQQLLTLSFLLGILFHVSAQRTVTGKVFAFKDTPLTNVKIVSKKGQKEVLSDINGRFSIDIDKKDKLIFTGAGFERHIQKVKAGDDISLKLYFLGGTENEKIAVGQGLMSKSSFQYASSNFLEYNNKNHTYTDIWMLIKGQFPGVKVLPREDGSGNKVVIRDIKYLSGRSDEALYLVDGQIWQDISVIQPAEVKSVNVMKDGASLGMRAVNGVVIITTIDEMGKPKSGNSRKLIKNKS